MSYTIGIYYELPDGRIVYTYGFHGAEFFGHDDSVICYYFDDGQGGREASQAEFQTWKPRPDLKDFPNARDPRLPYEFDLWYDIKHVSELRTLLAEGHDNMDHIRALMTTYNIVV